MMRAFWGLNKRLRADSRYDEVADEVAHDAGRGLGQSVPYQGSAHVVRRFPEDAQP